MHNDADCGTNAEICEVNVDTYLNDLCAHATLMRKSSTTYTPAAAMTMIKLPCPTSTITIHAAHLTTKTGIYTMSAFTMHAMSGSASAVHTTDHNKQASKQACMTYTPTVCKPSQYRALII